MAAHLSIPESFKSVNEALLCGLSLLGVDADLIPRSRGGSTARNPICFLSPSWYEIAWRGRKLLGSAQTRRGPWMLQHGSLPLTIDRPFLLSLFREGSRYSDDAIDNMASLSESQARTISSDHVIEALQEGFRRTFARDLLPDEWTQEEAGHAETLAYERYPLL
jgi:lipoate-protein ligase A